MNRPQKRCEEIVSIIIKSDLEHNFGHGKENLAALFATFNILSFLIHTVLEIVDDEYILIRQTLPSQETFFQDIRALTR